MSHGMLCMPRVEYPTEGLGRAVGSIHCRINVVHTNNVAFMPFIECIELNINMTGAFHGMVLVDHLNRGLVINEQMGWSRAWIAEFMEHGAQIFYAFGSRNGANELGLSTTGCHHWHKLCMVGHSATCIGNDMASNGMMVNGHSMSSVDTTSQLE